MNKFDSAGSLIISTFGGVLPASSFPALTGDITTAAGSLVTIIGAGKVTDAMLVNPKLNITGGILTGNLDIDHATNPSFKLKRAGTTESKLELYAGETYFDFTGILKIRKSATSAIVATLTDIGLLTLNGSITITTSVAIISLTSTTGTSNAFASFNNTGGASYVGREQSTGGNLFVGSSAYATILGTDSAHSVQIATSNNVRVTISSAGFVRVHNHVAGTPSFVAGDKYLVVDASGNFHVSALGPAS